MLERLKLQNIGPAPELELAYHSGVNLFTATMVSVRRFYWILRGGP